MEARAREFARAAYDSQEDLEHPVEVAELVLDAGADDETVAAALLHDLAEDTDVPVAAIRAEFGDRVGDMVAAMTEHESIEPYAARKEEARLRARDAGRDVALVFVADKLSNARRMRRGRKDPAPEKLAHYRATAELMRASWPDLPLLTELAAELDAF